MIKIYQNKGVTRKWNPRGREIFTHPRSVVRGSPLMRVNTKPRDWTTRESSKSKASWVKKKK